MARLRDWIVSLGIFMAAVCWFQAPAMAFDYASYVKTTLRELELAPYEVGGVSFFVDRRSFNARLVSKPIEASEEDQAMVHMACASRGIQLDEASSPGHYILVEAAGFRQKVFIQNVLAADLFNESLERPNYIKMYVAFLAVQKEKNQLPRLTMLLNAYQNIEGLELADQVYKGMSLEMAVRSIGSGTTADAFTDLAVKQVPYSVEWTLFKSIRAPSETMPAVLVQNNVVYVEKAKNGYRVLDAAAKPLNFLITYFNDERKVNEMRQFIERVRAEWGDGTEVMTGGAESVYRFMANPNSGQIYLKCSAEEGYAFRLENGMSMMLHAPNSYEYFVLNQEKTRAYLIYLEGTLRYPNYYHFKREPGTSSFVQTELP